MNADYMGNGIRLTFLREIDYTLNSLIRENSELLFMFTIAIMGISVFIFMIVFIMALVIKNHQDLEKPNILKKAFCLFLVAMLTFMHMPLFDLIIRTIISINEGGTALTVQIFRYAVCGLAIFFFSVLMIFLVRIFNVCVPT